MQGERLFQGERLARTVRVSASREGKGGTVLVSFCCHSVKDFTRFFLSEDCAFKGTALKSSVDCVGPNSFSALPFVLCTPSNGTCSFLCAYVRACERFSNVRRYIWNPKRVVVCLADCACYTRCECMHRLLRLPLRQEEAKKPGFNSPPSVHANLPVSQPSDIRNGPWSCSASWLHPNWVTTFDPHSSRVG